MEDTIRIKVEEQLAKVDALSLDGHLDENMKFPIAALLRHGFQVKGSCGGHLSRRTGGLYIDMIFPRYDEFIESRNFLTATTDDEVRLGKATSLIARQALTVVLTLIRHLNDFYKSHHTTYENVLYARVQPDFTIRLSAIGADIVETFGNEEKRKEWNRAVNQEFFDFGVYLFEHPLLLNLLK